MMGSNELQLLVQRALYAVVNASLEIETELLALSDDVIGFRRVKLAWRDLCGVNNCTCPPS